MKQAFLVSKDFGYQVLRALAHKGQSLVLHPHDDQDARSCESFIRDFCAQKQIEYHVVQNKEEALSRLRDFAPEITLVCGWYWILPLSFIKTCPLGVYGIHHSLLPAYRGGAPLVWALIQGEEIVGSSVFQLDEGTDSGDLVRQVQVPVPRSAHIAEVRAQLENKILETLPQDWQDLKNSSLKLVPQKQSAKNKNWPQRKPEDGLIDWHWPAGRVHDFIRAQSPPYPCAFVRQKGGRRLFLRSEETGETAPGAAGTVLWQEKGQLKVICGDGSCLLLGYKDE